MLFKIFLAVISFSCLISCVKKEIIELPLSPDVTWKHFATDIFNGEQAFISNLQVHDSLLQAGSSSYFNDFDFAGHSFGGVINNNFDLSGLENALSANYYAYTNYDYGKQSRFLFKYINKLHINSTEAFFNLNFTSIDSAFTNVGLKYQNGIFNTDDVFLTNFSSVKDIHPHLTFIKMGNLTQHFTSWKTVSLLEEDSSKLTMVRAVDQYFLIAAQHGTYRTDSSGAFVKVSDQSFQDFFIFHDTCFADQGNAIYRSLDKGLSWELHGQNAGNFGKRNFFSVNDKLYFFTIDKIYAVKNLENMSLESINTIHLEGNIITSIVQAGQRVYAGTTNNGIFYKNLVEF